MMFEMKKKRLKILKAPDENLYKSCDKIRLTYSQLYLDFRQELRAIANPKLPYTNEE